MINRPIIAIVAGLAVTIFGAPVWACDAVHTTAAETRLLDPASVDTSVLNQSMIAEINAHRCLNGLPVLDFNATLENTAKHHSDWMADTQIFAHESTEAGMVNPWDRAQHYGYGYRKIAENLALFPLYDFREQPFLINGTCKFSRKSGEPIEPISYAQLAQQVGVGWMNSPGHRANILLDGIDEAAVAITIDQTAEYCGNVYITMMYGSQMN